ncbi:thioredoxin [Pycnococcus provasolii]
MSHHLSLNHRNIGLCAVSPRGVCLPSPSPSPSPSPPYSSRVGSRRVGISVGGASSSRSPRNCGGSGSHVQKQIFHNENNRINIRSAFHGRLHVATPRHSDLSAFHEQYTPSAFTPPPYSSRSNETHQQRLIRQKRESVVVESRIKEIQDEVDFALRLSMAEDRLVVLEVDSELHCDSSHVERADVHWKSERRDDGCSRLRSTIQRCARECEDVEFLHLNGDTSAKLCEKLEIGKFPTLLFYRHGRLLWTQSGYRKHAIGEGVLYYGSRLAGGEDSQRLVPDVSTESEIAALAQKNAQSGCLFTVVACTSTFCEPCVRVFPAALALAKALPGVVGFCRISPEDETTCDFFRKFCVENLPTFLLVKPDGSDINAIVVEGRYIGSSRGDLMGHVMQALPPQNQIYNREGRCMDLER